MNYEAKITRDGRWWMIDVPGVGTTQARRLGEVELMARELIAVTTDVKLEDVTVKVHLSDIGGVSGKRLAGLAEDRAQMVALEKRVAEDTRSAAVGLVEAGVPLRDVGEILGVSYQRAHQLVNS